MKFLQKKQRNTTWFEREMDKFDTFLPHSNWSEASYDEKRHKGTQFRAKSIKYFWNF